MKTVNENGLSRYIVVSFMVGSCRRRVSLDPSSELLRTARLRTIRAKTAHRCAEDSFALHKNVYSTIPLLQVSLPENW